MSEKQRNAVSVVLYLIGAILILYVLLSIGVTIWCMSGYAVSPRAVEACSDGRIGSFITELIAAAVALYAAGQLRGSNGGK